MSHHLSVSITWSIAWIVENRARSVDSLFATARKVNLRLELEETLYKLLHCCSVMFSIYGIISSYEQWNNTAIVTGSPKKNRAKSIMNDLPFLWQGSENFAMTSECQIAFGNHNFIQCMLNIKMNICLSAAMHEVHYFAESVGIVLPPCFP